MSSLKRAFVLASVAVPPAIAAFVLAPDSSTSTLAPIAGALAVSALMGWAVAAKEGQKLRTISAVLAAYREGDFSIRPKRVGPSQAFLDVQEELNGLGDVLRTHRLSEIEAWALLRKVMSEVDVVVLAINDSDKRVHLANDAAEALLRRPERRELLGANAIDDLGLGDLLGGEAPRVVELLSGGASSFELRRGSFRLAGEAHTLLVLSDVSRVLRENERDAWKRLIRVMGHEINNSLTPIRSISESLLPLADPVRRAQQPKDWEDDLRDGLSVIARRADALNRFMTSYAMLAKLPPPRKSAVSLATLIKKVVAIESAHVEADLPDVMLDADADQLEQAIINLLKNAREAMKGGGIGTVRWNVADGDDDNMVDLTIEDEGPGVSNATGLFVPFFTTKPEGSGIGLVLSRQIIEAHDGTLSLSSRTDGKTGAIARIRLRKQGK